MSDINHLKTWFANEEIIYSILCSGVVVTLVYWPLLNSIFCLALAAYWLFFSKKTFSYSSQRSRMIIFFSMLYVLVIVGSLYSVDTKEALFKIQQKAPYLIFPLIFGTIHLRGNKVLKISITSFVFATLSACLLCLGYAVYQSLFLHTNYYLTGYGLVTLKNMHPVIMGLCCILSVIFLLENWYVEKKGTSLPSFWKPAAVFFLLAFVLLVGNRSNLFCLAAVMVFYGFRLIPKWKNRVLFISGFLAIALVAFLLNPALQRQWNDLIDFSKEKSIQLDSNQPAAEIYGGKTLRLAIWSCAADIIKEKWMTGVGTGDVYPALEEAYKKRQFNSAAGHKEYNAHNQYLQETISYGIIGGLLLVALIVVPLMMNVHPSVKTPYLLFLLTFAFVCLTESLLELNKGIVWYSFFNSVLFFTAENRRTPS